jgi:multicomponent Na+:H+ antiporter subunit F
MYIVAAAAIFVTMALAIVRALLGPTVYDRLLAANTFGTNTVLMISVLSFASGRQGFIDLALTYALINFIGTIAVLKFFEHGSLAISYITVPPPTADGSDS